MVSYCSVNINVRDYLMENIYTVSILSTNFLGCMLGLTLYVANSWRWKRDDLENTLLILMLVLVGGTCITEPCAFMMMGKEGMLAHIALYVCDTWTYASDLVSGACWLFFIIYHLNGEMIKPVGIFIKAVAGAGVLLLIINLFTPVVFRIGWDNSYERLPLFYLYLIVDMLFLVSSLIFYIYIRLKGRRLKFFFFWVYMLPIVIGTAIQTRVFGISLIAPTLLIGLTGLMSTIQNELIFKDKLTGLYNRYYLDQLGEEFKNSRDAEYTFIMIDINDFKSINDRFGHLIGDRAIIDTARILRKSIGTAGAAIRYAGDEFVIALSTKNQIDTDIFITNIRKGFEDFNATGEHPYDLNVSMGYSVVNLMETGIDEVMNRIDRLMYEDKKKYYETHTHMERRKGEKR